MAEEEDRGERGSEHPRRWVQGLRASVGLGPPEPKPNSWASRLLPCCQNLNYRQRLTGFVLCMGASLLLSFTSVSSVTSALLGNPIPLGFRYTIANVLSLVSYCFLVGPEQHCKGMFAPGRRLNTVVYLSSLIATFFCIFYLHSRFLTMGCLLVQCVAMVYYALSYLPFGQSLLNRVIFGSR